MGAATVDRAARSAMADLVARVGVATRGVLPAVGRVAFRSDRPVGLDASLEEVSRQPWGPPLTALVAAGFLAYGAFSLVQSRRLKLLEP